MTQKEEAKDVSEIKKEFGWNLSGDSPDNPRSKFFFEADAEKIQDALTRRDAEVKILEDRLKDFEFLTGAGREDVRYSANKIASLESEIAELKNQIAEGGMKYDDEVIKNSRLQSTLQRSVEVIKPFAEEYEHGMNPGNLKGKRASWDCFAKAKSFLQSLPTEGGGK